jgi:hypothetical protein
MWYNAFLYAKRVPNSWPDSRNLQVVLLDDCFCQCKNNTVGRYILDFSPYFGRFSVRKQYPLNNMAFSWYYVACCFFQAACCFFQAAPVFHLMHSVPFYACPYRLNVSKQPFGIRIRRN